LELERRLYSTLDRDSPVLLLLHRNLYKWRTTNRVWCVDFHRWGGGVFIGVQGGVTDLVKSVTHQVVDGRPSHVARRPQGLAFTDFWLRISCYRLLESVTVKPTHERLQSGAGRPVGLTGWPPPGSTGQQSLHITSLCQVHSWGDTYFGGIPIFLVIS
jgi:hypothetical protein